MGTALILYPNQLFDVEFLPKVGRIYLVEEPLLFGGDKELPISFHKQKLVLQRAAMRRYAEEVLWPNGFEVEYIECAEDVITDTAVVRAAFEGASEIIVFDPVDERLWKRIESASQSLEVHVPLKKLENPNFYLKQRDIDTLFREKTPDFTEFYQYMRERFDVLIDKDYKPFGGKLIYDKPQKAIGKEEQLPGIRTYGDNDFVREAVTYVELKFPNNNGRTNNFFWPTNKEESKAWLKDFFEHRLEKFGEYSQVLDDRGVWLYHGALSPLMNIGLLSSREVVEATLDFAASTKKELKIENLESFVRQILGWREYIRALYVRSGANIATKNLMSNNKKLTVDWYQATTNIKPLDDAIRKARDFGYLHQAERSMVIGNMMLLCDIAPKDVYGWFMSMSVDAVEWSAVPNVFLFSQMVDGGSVSNKLPIISSNGILSQSNYQKDHWCDVWDGLYWRFVDSRRLMLKKVPRLGTLLLNKYDKMDGGRKRIIGYRAQDFLDNYTKE
ncbi:cryptochrome/photolyase family protein [Candidatus Saccharibacteria bacterium]|nr:cryptochrome/photolyase family protein [Candidatus Saccharibacteria bacterium]